MIHRKSYDNGWIDLELLNLIFPNLRSIVSLLTGSLKDFIEVALDFVQNHRRDSQINIISVTMANQSELDHSDNIIFRLYRPLLCES